MKTDYLASVIIVGHNGQAYLDACLASLLDQTLPPAAYEIIYADNGSDPSPIPDLQRRYPTVRYLAFERNLGFAAGNNRAAAAAHGAYLIFLNQDTVAHRDALRALLAPLQTHAQLGGVYANQIMPADPEFTHQDRLGRPAYAYWLTLSRLGYTVRRRRPATEALIPALFLSGGAFAIPRRVLAELGFLFEADFGAYAEDLELGLRLLRRGWRLALAPQAVVYHATQSPLHNPQRGLRPADWRLTIQVTRNRWLAFYRNLGRLEFWLYAPWLAAGAPLKALQLPRPWPVRLAAALAWAALLPLAAVETVRLARRLPDVAQDEASAGHHWGAHVESRRLGLPLPPLLWYLLTGAPAVS